MLSSAPATLMVILSSFQSGKKPSIIPLNIRSLDVSNVIVVDINEVSSILFKSPVYYSFFQVASGSLNSDSDYSISAGK